jgi:hypothetical protein
MSFENWNTRDFSVFSSGHIFKRGSSRPSQQSEGERRMVRIGDRSSQVLGWCSPVKHGGLSPRSGRVVLEKRRGDRGFESRTEHSLGR